MQYVLFDSYNTYNDFAVSLNSKEIETPRIKNNSINIAGANGLLDLSESFGEVKFENRKLTFEFTFLPEIDRTVMLYRYSIVQTAIHGRKMNIILPDHYSWYYYGRISVGSLRTKNGVGTFTVECDCDPFRYSANETIYTQYINGGAQFAIENERMSVVPVFDTDATFSFEFRNNPYSHAAGTFQIQEIELREGSNYIYAIGTGTVSITFRKGRL